MDDRPILQYVHDLYHDLGVQDLTVQTDHASASWWLYSLLGYLQSRLQKISPAIGDKIAHSVILVETNVTRIINSNHSVTVVSKSSEGRSE